MAELSSSKINRQLRSLRMKCTSLNALALAPTKPAVSVTYGSSHRNVSKHAQDDDGTPPLAILQSLDHFGARLHLDRAIIENVGRMLKIMVYIVEIAVRMIIHNVRERAHLESVVDSSATVKNAQDLSGLATRVEREGKLEEVIKRQLRHF